MKLGEKQFLTVVKKVDFGVYLGSEEEHVLLPIKQVPKDVELGDPVEVFLYKDSEDRLIATTHEPKLTLGKLAVLEVADVGRMGAFLNWGLEKDLFLPFKEQTVKVKKGDKCLVSLYVDKSSRLCATMKVYHLLGTDSPYKKDDKVSGIIYDTSEEFGVFVAVDNQYSALIPKKEVFGSLPVGKVVEARVTAVKRDGKLDLSLRDRIPEQMDKDVQTILKVMQSYDGELPFTDKAAPEKIRQELGMSKAAFKRGVGRLLKAGKVEILEKSIRIL
ncbi:hypothetical protein BN3456_00746 [Clostridium sp. C105KSO13]|nr:S1-like domain-containing RNA-binding protein [Clostridium sp. C105KSO13]CUX24534.1 hypothetical protein BN3456_00746 [Clostridium sp. C105KSO13]